MPTGARRRSRKGLKGLYLIVMLVFLYLPILVMIALSFNRSESRAVWTGFTFDWYARLVQDARIISALKVTLSVAAMATVLSTAIGSLAAHRHALDAKGLVEPADQRGLPGP